MEANEKAAEAMEVEETAAPVPQPPQPQPVKYNSDLNDSSSDEEWDIDEWE